MLETESASNASFSCCSNNESTPSASFMPSSTLESDRVTLPDKNMADKSL